MEVQSEAVVQFRYGTTTGQEKSGEESPGKLAICGHTTA
jgi:hypothetical protein